MSTEDASKRFRQAERRKGEGISIICFTFNILAATERSRTHYAYPPSPTSLSPPHSPTHTRPIPLAQRLRNLQSELASLETELADPTNPQLHKEREEDNVDPGELIRGLVDVRSRLDRIRKGKEGRGKLVSVVLADDSPGASADSLPTPHATKGAPPQASEVQSLAQLDQRVGELEKLVGASTMSLDEVCCSGISLKHCADIVMQSSPLPPPLLPQISRLTTQMTLLTQPRHIDSVSRRLKLLLSDLDRAAASQHGHRRNTSQPTASGTPQAHIQEQLLPLLTRLGPSLPQIPHILTRLRTLSTLHAAAGEFQGTLDGLEEEQRKVAEALGELETAVETVETSMEANRNVVKGNVEGLEKRVDNLFRRLDELDRER